MKQSLHVFILCLGLFSMASFDSLRTDLRINVRNELGNLEADVNVSLYKTKEQYEKSEGAVFTGTTDIKGNVTFDGVEPIAYYVGAEKGDKNNFGAGEKTEVLQANKLNKMTVIISE
jgi:hypothetical protein